jgi:fatty-acyl-CoA synthase
MTGAGGDFGIGSWPARRARIDPAGVALRQGDRALTYGRLEARVERLAATLAALGVEPGDRVAWLGPNDLRTFELLFATTRRGAVFVPLNTRLARPEIEFLLGDSAPRLLVHLDGFEGFDRPPGSRTLHADDLAELDAAVPPAGERPVGLEDPAVILYTSGTTGRPKGAVLTHGNLTFNVMNQLAHIDVLSSDTALCVSPLFHATGLGQVSLPTLFKGGTVVVLPRFDPELVLRTVAEQRIASFSAVPTMLQRMAEHPRFADTDLSSLRYVNYGGSPVLDRVARAWLERGVTLLQGYGMTEASPGVTMAAGPGARTKPTSIGVPHFFTDVAYDHSGELLVRGPNVFRGYWNRPDSTREAFTDGWYRTGDVVRADGDGWAYVVDRIKDLIISGGENVYPAEVEAVIATLPGVLDCAVVAVPDDRWGEVGAAFLVVEPGTAWTADGLRDALRDRLAAYKIPRAVSLVPALPRTVTGKVRRDVLRSRAWS